MRIIVLSDTHGNPKVLETILARHADADACIHLGDSEGDVKLFLSCHPEWESKFYAVRGNCDFNSSLPISRTIDLIPGHRIFAVHGHRHAISYTPDILVEEAIAEGCNIVLHGHTHVRRNEYRNGVYLMNPGSAAQPRDGMPPSYAYIDYEKGGIFISHISLQAAAGIPVFILCSSCKKVSYIFSSLRRFLSHAFFHPKIHIQPQPVSQLSICISAGIWCTADCLFAGDVSGTWLFSLLRGLQFPAAAVLFSRKRCSSQRQFRLELVH